MKINATHVLLTLVLCALLVNAFLILQPPVRAATLQDDLSDVVDQMREVSGDLQDVSSRLGRLDGIEQSLSTIAGSDIWDLRPTSAGGSGQGLPVVVVE